MKFLLSSITILFSISAFSFTSDSVNEIEVGKKIMVCSADSEKVNYYLTTDDTLIVPRVSPKHARDTIAITGAREIVKIFTRKTISQQEDYCIIFKKL